MRTHTKPLHIKLTLHEASLVSALADHYGLSMAGLVRMLVRTDATALGIGPKKVRAGAPKR